MLRRPPGLRLLLAALASALLLPSFADAQTWVGGPPPKRRFIHRNSVFLRLNPTGLIHDGRFAFRNRLYYDESDALSDNFVGIGLAPSLSPAFSRLGLYVEFQPATILTFWANYEVVAYFGEFNFLQSFRSASDVHTDAEIKRLSELPVGDPAKNYATIGTQLTVGGNFQFKLGNTVIRTAARLVRPDYKLRVGDRVFYDVVYDVMAPNQGLFFTNDADLLYQSDAGPRGEQWTLGLRHTVTHAFYDQRHVADGEPVSAAEVNNTMHRAGLLYAYTFRRENRLAFNAPTLVAGIQWWLQHRDRANSPLFLMGFSFDGDLMSSLGGKT
jgi:hypothetical protein